VSDLWLLLIYTVPPAPSRKRATIWRALKQAGAVYLRDGVCALPQREETAAALRAIAAKVEEFAGQATLVESANLAPARAEAIVAQALRERAAEYAELAREAEGFLEHIARETAHRAFTFREVEELEGDLEKLRRWVAQVRARDYFGAAEAGQVDLLLARCDEALGTFLEEASQRDEATQ
jgi:polyhydroxyalkanoate synthesis regulator phasin